MFYILCTFIIGTLVTLNIFIYLKLLTLLSQVLLISILSLVKMFLIWCNSMPDKHFISEYMLFLQMFMGDQGVGRGYITIIMFGIVWNQNFNNVLSWITDPYWNKLWLTLFYRPLVSISDHWSLNQTVYNCSIQYIWLNVKILKLIHVEICRAAIVQLKMLNVHRLGTTYKQQLKPWQPDSRYSLEILFF